MKEDSLAGIAEQSAPAEVAVAEPAGGTESATLERYFTPAVNPDSTIRELIEAATSQPDNAAGSGAEQV